MQGLSYWHLTSLITGGEWTGVAWVPENSAMEAKTEKEMEISLEITCFKCIIIFVLQTPMDRRAANSSQGRVEAAVALLPMGYKMETRGTNGSVGST